MEYVKAFMKRVDKISEKHSRLEVEEIEQNVSVLTSRPTNKTSNKHMLLANRDRNCKETKEEKTKCLFTACVCFLSLMVNILFGVCLYMNCAYLLQEYRQDTNCGTDLRIFIYEDQQIWDLRLTEALVSLLKVALIAKTTSTCSFGCLQDKSHQPSYSRPAVNFVFNTSSSQDFGLLWKKPLWFESSTFHITEDHYNEGAVSIPKTGLYALYNSICLSKKNDCRGNCNKKQSIQHKLYMERNNTRYTNFKVNKSLLFQKETLLGSTEMEYHTSSVFDVVYLQRGDILYPWLSDISLVYKYPVVSQWGLFALKLDKGGG